MDTGDPEQRGYRDSFGQHDTPYDIMCKVNTVTLALNGFSYYYENHRTFRACGAVGPAGLCLAAPSLGGRTRSDLCSDNNKSCVAEPLRFGVTVTAQPTCSN